MAKTPTKPTKAAPPQTIEKPVKAPAKSAAAKPAKPLKAAEKPPKTAVAKGPTETVITKPSKTAAKPEAAKAKKAVKASSTIAQLASDILADRILPTIEQIKTIALHALGQDEKGKSKKKKSPK